MANRMSKKNWLIRITLIIVVLALAGVALSCDSSLLSQKAPDFTLPALTGANITLSELEGTPVVINFWATWCQYCAPELPYFEAIAQDSEGGIKVIAIDVGESASTVQTFFAGYEPTMIVALDRNGEVFVNYCQGDNPRRGIPFTLFVDSEGIVQYVQVGAFTSEAALWDKLSSVLGITAP
jgi:thiol-disulfide isomerase/thioredoxin